MQQFKNVSPLGALEVPLLCRIVERDEVIEVTEDQAPLFAGQADWVACGGQIVSESGPELADLPDEPTDDVVVEKE